jgi:WD40 repeat protein
LDGSDIRELELPSGALLAVSVSGELAIALANGNLARVPPGSRAPREVLEGIEAADFSPDGKQLAVTRFVNGKSRLEYPIGRVLFETIGQIGEMRISPKGDAIAFMEHPVSGDDRGTIALVDVEGHKRTLTREWNGEQGIAWSADGREIWFTATERYDWERALYAVTPSGQQRVVLRSPAALYLQDISRDGRILLNRSDRRFEVVVADLGGKTEVWNWAQILVLGSVSRDGQYAVVGDWGSETTYSTYLARFDGSPPILLGSGAASGISPDNKWVASILPSDTSKVLLLPTGVGDVKTITAPNFHYRSADWTADGNLVVRASEGDRPIRFWTQDITGGQPRAITPEGVDGRFVTVKNADYVCARDAKEKFQLFPITAGTPRAVPGLSSKDAVVGGSPSSNVLYVMPENWELTAEVWKVNIDSGTRSPFFKIGPSDTAGVIGVSPPKVVADGRRYLYVQVREFSVLYEAAGVK